MLSDCRAAVLAAICDTVVPSIERARPRRALGAQGERPRRRRGRRAADRRDPDPAASRRAVQLIDALGAQGIARAPSQASREQILRNIALSDPPGRGRGRRADRHDPLPCLRRARSRHRPEPELERPSAIPGPISAAARGPEDARIHEPEGSEETLEADVCVVGSGSGGAVVAAGLAAARARTWSCWRPPATSTSPTSPSSSSLPTSRCTGAAGPTRPPTATSAWSPAPRSAAARRSTGPTACAPAPGSASSGRGSTASRASTAPTSTATSTRC